MRLFSVLRYLKYCKKRRAHMNDQIFWHDLLIAVDGVCPQGTYCALQGVAFDCQSFYIMFITLECMIAEIYTFSCRRLNCKYYIVNIYTNGSVFLYCIKLLLLYQLIPDYIQYTPKEWRCRTFSTACAFFWHRKYHSFANDFCVGSASVSFL